MTHPDLSCSWLGLPLRNPLLVGACASLSEDLDDLLRLEQAGAAGVVLHSLFEEQIERDQLELWRVSIQGSNSYAESLDYFPEPSLFHVGHNLYLRHLEQARARLEIPVIASLNGVRPGEWVKVARRLQDAGASAIELNIYAVPTDPDLSSTAIEGQVEEIVREVRAEVTLPLAVKLGPYYTNLAALAKRLAAAGADGLVLFNRFYQPDIDIEELVLRPNLLLSTPHDLRLPLRWIALLHGRAALELAGAGCVQVVGALLRHGPQRLEGLRDELAQWLVEHDHASARELIGTMSQQRCPDPAEYERAQYMRAISTYTTSEAALAPGPW
ncbi:MAG: dihydroorotate dehydrogenase-like protein [Cyanobium sp.]